MTKVLVAYASKRGATVEIATAIADKLRERHMSVDCRPARSVENLFGYDAVVIGSAVYFNRWRPEAMRFLRRNASRLADMPFWTFSSGPVGDTPASTELEPRRESMGGDDRRRSGARAGLAPRQGERRVMPDGDAGGGRGRPPEGRDGAIESAGAPDGAPADASTVMLRWA